MLRPIWLILAGFSLYAQDEPAVVGEWRATGSLQEARERACAVRLQDARVLISGGNGQYGLLASAELYSSDAKFQLVSPLGTPRAGHTCTLLNDGRVLVAGGDLAGRGTLELFDPATSNWTAAGEAGQPLAGHTATLLPDGKVLIVGEGVTLLFDPSSDTTVPAALATAGPRSGHVAVLLPSGAVMVIGGRHEGAVLNTVEIIDPVAFTVETAPGLNQRRAGHSANLLDDGRIVVIGGTDGRGDLATAEILSLNDDAPAWTPVARKLLEPRSGHIAVAVPGHGGILVAGGTGNGQALASTEVFQSSDETFVGYKDLTAARSGIAAAILDGGVILAMGGANESGVQRACGVTAVPTIQFDRPLYLSGDVVVASASGFPARSTGAATVDLLAAKSSTGVSIQNRLIAPANARLSPGTTESSMPATKIVQAIGTDAGKLIRVIIAASPSGVTASATVPVKIRTSISVITGPSVFEGQPASFNVVLTRSENQGPMVGSIGMQYLRFSLVLGTDSFLLQGVEAIPLNRSFPFSSDQPRQITVQATYSGDSRYHTSTASADFIFGEKQVDFARHDLRFDPPLVTWGTPVTLTATGTVFTGLPSSPVPGGLATFEINGATIGQSVLTRAADGTSFEASASYTPLSGAALESLTIRYNGDSFYRASVPATRQFLVRPAPTTLTFVNPPAAYECTGPTAFNLQLGFPATLGIANRSVQVGQVNNGVFTALSGPSGAAINATLTPLTSTPGAAAATFSASLPTGLTRLAASFDGDLFLGSSTATIPIAMNKVTTSVQISGTATTLVNPVTLRALVATPAICQAPAAQGTLQFFDGDLLVGAQTLSSGAASIVVSRPAGTRTLKVKYLGDSFRKPSEASRVVTYQ
jgi:hypothetical protein